MLYIVCYDIGDDRRRERLVKVLLDYGQRIQESVFAAHLDDELHGRMVERVRKVVDATEDRAHVIRLCKACEDEVLKMGLAELKRDSDFWIV